MAEHGSTSETTPSLRRQVLVAASLASFLTPYMGSSINVSLPTIGNEFGVDAVLLNWLATAFILATAVFIVPAGRLADIHGRKRVFVVGLLVYLAGTALCVHVPSVDLLIGVRVLQGIGSAMVFGTSVALLSSVYPPAERGRALGISIASVYLGLTLGPSIGGFLTHNFGWRAIFLVTIPLGLVALVLLLRIRGEWAEARNEPLDLVGSVLYGVGLCTLMLGLSALPGTIGLILVAGGLAVFFLFGWWELRVPFPVIQLSLFRDNRVYLFSNLAALINYSATFGIGFLLSFYLQHIRDLDAQTTGLILLSQPLVQTVISPIAGRASDRIEPRLLASSGMALMVGGLVLFAFLDRFTPVGLIFGVLMTIGLGYGLFSSPNTNAIMGAVERRFYGVASGMVATMRLIGQLLSLEIVMLALVIFVGRVQLTDLYDEDLLGAIRISFAVFAVLCTVGVCISLARGNRKDG
ncbi:MAG TPA: MFS transporter [Methanoregulaceae archaeon]|nr:MFS transporter [Methanoregulaceae archaeon]HQJ87338.1 MFS transporter [Methanoregulaceae archaeon]